MSWKSLQSDLAAQGYIANDSLAMAVYLACDLKTEIAKQLAGIHHTRLIRLQCYEGLDANTTIYEWNYQKQLLRVQASQGENAQALETQIFSDQFLLKRPLLDAITQKKPPVLLIDEIDRADEEFEAYLLEVLSDYQVSIPEIGTIDATSKPMVVLTSNGSRDLSDALRRRCFYTYVSYPDTETEIAIAEMLDWAAAVAGLGVAKLSDNPLELQATLVCLLKTQADQFNMPTEITQRLVGKVVV